MDFYQSPKQISAFDAKFEAQKIAFAPITFQVARCLLKFDLLAQIEAKPGSSRPQLASLVDLSDYAVGVLLDMALSMGLVWQDDQGFHLDKIGHFLLHDEMSRVNLNFNHDVCYQGMFELDKALENGEASGLKVFGDWQTIYPGLDRKSVV